MLGPDQGGMFPPAQHPDQQISLDDYRRALVQLVDSTRRDPRKFTDEERVAVHVVALRAANINPEALAYILAWALIELAKAPAAEGD